jgi:hypothetical protein
MVANVWLDRTEGLLHYNIEDPRHRLLTTGGGGRQEQGDRSHPAYRPQRRPLAGGDPGFDLWR